MPLLVHLRLLELDVCPVEPVPETEPAVTGMKSRKKTVAFLAPRLFTNLPFFLNKVLVNSPVLG